MTPLLVAVYIELGHRHAVRALKLAGHVPVLYEAMASVKFW